MEADFWLQRWREGRIGFHEGQFNRHLQRWWPRLGVAAGARVLVPLCGKAHDLRWLVEQGHRVLGVDLAEQALKDFTEEHGEHEGLTLLAHDFFHLRDGEVEEALGGAVQAWYDRAALIALPPEMRRDYVAQLAQLLPSGAVGLLVAIAYPAEQRTPPPFTVEDAEVRELFAADFELELLDEQDVLDNEPHRRVEGVTRLEERVYRLRRK